jgi:hypothetical protein
MASGTETERIPWISKKEMTTNWSFATLSTLKTNIVVHLIHSATSFCYVIANRNEWEESLSRLRDVIMPEKEDII